MFINVTIINKHRIWNLFYPISLLDKIDKKLFDFLIWMNIFKNLITSFHKPIVEKLFLFCTLVIMDCAIYGALRPETMEDLQDL